MEMINVHVEYLYKLYTGNIGKKYEGNVKILKQGTNTVSRSLTLTFTDPNGKQKKTKQSYYTRYQKNGGHESLQNSKGALLEIIYSGDMKSLNGF